VLNVAVGMEQETAVAGIVNADIVLIKQFRNSGLCNDVALGHFKERT